MRPVLCYCETHRHLDEGVSQADGWALTRAHGRCCVVLLSHSYLLTCRDKHGSEI